MSQVPTAGWLVNIKSIGELYDYIVKSEKMNYICTFKLSQDPLENFFSSVRMSLGCGNNPTTTQFKAAFESLLCNSLNRKEELWFPPPPPPPWGWYPNTFSSLIFVWGNSQQSSHAYQWLHCRVQYSTNHRFRVVYKIDQYFIFQLPIL